MSLQDNVEIKTFLDNIVRHGLGRCGQLPEYMQYEGVGKALAGAALAYWAAGDKSLERFAQELNAAAEIGLNNAALDEFINIMNLGYIAQKSDQQRSETEIAQELLFWDGCPLTEVQIYFDGLSEQFIKIVAKAKDISDGVYAVMQHTAHFEAMSRLQMRVNDILRKKLTGSLVLSADPKDRLKLLLRYAANAKSAALIDDELWEQATQEISSASRVSSQVYLELRQLLLKEAQHQEEKSNIIFLQKLNAMIVSMDTATNWGGLFDPQVMLAYWRSKRFEGVYEEALLNMYSAWLEKTPKAARDIIKQDYALLKNKIESRELSKLLEDAAQGIEQDGVTGASRRRSDGFQERANKKNVRSIPFTYIIFGAVVLAIAIYVGILTTKYLKKAPAQRSPSTTATPTPKATEAPDKEAEESKEPEKTKTPKNSPTPTPEPTPEPALEEEIPEEPIIELTPEPDNLPEETEVVEEPINENQEIPVP